MFILGPSGLPRGVREPHPDPYVFIGFLAPRRPWGLQCFHRIFWFLKCLEDSEPTLFSQVLWLPKKLWFHRLLAPRGAWELQNPLFSQIVVPLGGPRGSKTLCHKFSGSSGGLGAPNLVCFTRFLARRGHWGSKTYCFHWCSGLSEAVGARKRYGI